MSNTCDLKVKELLLPSPLLVPSDPAVSTLGEEGCRLCPAGRLGFTGQHLEQRAPSPHSQGGWVAMQGHEQSQMLHCSSHVETSNNTLVLVLLNVAGKPEITGQEKGCRAPLNCLQREWPSGSTEEELVCSENGD